MNRRTSVRHVGRLAAAAAALLFCGAATELSPSADPTVIPLVPLPHGAAAVHATVNGHPGVFLFDTGLGVTVVTPATAARAGCHPWGRITGFRAIGERIDMPRCDRLTVALDGVALVAPIAGVFDLRRAMPPDMPPLDGAIGLDLFAQHVVTVEPAAGALVLETPSSFAARIRHATEIPVRLVRDVQGVALTVDATVPTRDGTAFMELDTGNAGPILIDRSIAAALGLDPSRSDEQRARLLLGGQLPVAGSVHLGDLILDGDIGAAALAPWTLTLDLPHGLAWLAAARR